MAVRKTKKGAALRRWFKEEWVDVRTGKPCGRRRGEKRGVPYCRPKKRVSSATPKTASEMSSSEKSEKIAEKKITMGKASRLRAEKHFDIQNWVKRHETVFNELLRNRL